MRNKIIVTYSIGTAIFVLIYPVIIIYSEYERNNRSSAQDIPDFIQDIIYSIFSNFGFTLTGLFIIFNLINLIIFIYLPKKYTYQALGVLLFAAVLMLYCFSVLTSVLNHRF